MAGREWTERHIVELIKKHGGSVASTRSSSIQAQSVSVTSSSSPQEAKAIVEAYWANRKEANDGDS